MSEVKQAGSLLVAMFGIVVWIAVTFVLLFLVAPAMISAASTAMTIAGFLLIPTVFILNFFGVVYLAKKTLALQNKE